MSRPTFGRSPAWFLVTPPRIRPDVFPRPRVSSLITAEFATRPVVVLAAPPGYGKTVAAQEWLMSTSGIVGWVSVPHEVDTPAELARWVSAALRRADPRFDAALSNGSIPTLPQLSAVISGLSTNVALVIDDAHRAVSALDSRPVQIFLRHAPENLQVLLAGHGEVTAALSRMIVHDDASLVSGAVLAFTADEVDTAAKRHGIVLPLNEVDALLTNTAGWPIAVRSALADRDPAVVSDYIANVVASLPDDLADFVLAATTTDTVDAELALVLTGRADAAEAIEQCRTRSLFLDRFDDHHAPGRPPVYRWHKLFAHTCRTLLATRDPQRATALHAAAAAHLRRREPVNAARQALLAADTDLAYSIVVDEWLTAVIGSQGGELDRVCRELRVALSGEDRHEQRAIVSFVQACCRDLDGDRVGAGILRTEAQRTLGPSPSQCALLVRDLAAMICSDDSAELGDAATRTAQAVTDPKRNAIAAPGSAMHCCALFITGWTELRLRRHPSLAADLLTAARTECAAAEGADEHRLVGLERWIRANEAFALAASGQFTAATRLTQLTHRDAAHDRAAHDTWASYDADIEDFAVAFVAMWQGDLERSLQMFTALSPIDGVRDGYQPMARIHRALAATSLNDLVAIADAEASLALMPDTDLHGVAWSAFTAMARARIAESRGARDHVLDIVTDILSDTRAMPALNATLAASCIRLGAADRAPQLLNRIDQATLPPYIAAFVHVVEAMLAEQHGDHTAADAALQSALNVAAPERVMFPFVDRADPWLNTMLSRYSGVHERFVGACLAAHGKQTRGMSPTRVHLTKREAELVGLLRSQMSMAEIASTLHISENTLNTHRKSLYRKLGASNRRDALRLAQAIAL